MIKNETTGKVLAKNVKVCNSDWSKGIGLIFTPKKEDFGMIFPFNKSRKASLHMVFMFYSIDVLFLDEEKKVVDIKNNFKPFTFYTSKERVKYVIEFPFIVKAKLGDIISF